MNFTLRTSTISIHESYLNKGLNCMIFIYEHGRIVPWDGKATANNLWIWHSFFVLSSSHNDVNGLPRSLLFTRLVARDSPPCNYVVNDHQYKISYYLTGAIYPPWVTFVKAIQHPQSNKRSHFVMHNTLRMSATWKRTLGSSPMGIMLSHNMMQTW
jgi:hypothetical protein